MSNPDSPRESASEYSVDDDNQLQPEDTLIDRGVDDVLDEGYTPAEKPYGGASFDSGPESLDQLLAEEEPDPAMKVYDPLDKDEQQRSDAAERETEFPQRDEVGRARAGRLVAPDRGFGGDFEAELVADDVGIDGGAASAEEAAVHIIDDEQP
ncbi:hypothetical protein BST33_05205 [Mycolicibacter minnesotensis]|uniref:Uncharacterized protein n=1 Tax=Mycolicibacter minnesotensis TaxID=1118379 RepID=A0A7I7R2G1_9MYCO|nr:DUF5709 domain-containing protein [Mycolicibacter minnesotensis]ORB02511.1 hypothetical protein BST33_05205 [Mycolicibacter minnesotensis]BBY32849.1 hypothetical protein MMIN_09100 [Mycolicibacter minnesotensis]